MSKFQKSRPHPWHGLSAGKNPPLLMSAYIEITPLDAIKYEVDKESGYLKVDRPQITSSLPPALYGFIPQTYCGEGVARLSKRSLRGDGDPLDICVFSERQITKSEVIVPARVIGGFRMVDRDEADDKIIAVLEMDPFLENLKDIKDLNPLILNRLKHYFLTYKMIPGVDPLVQIDEVYGVEHASQVIAASMTDYKKEFSEKLPD